MPAATTRMTTFWEEALSGFFDGGLSWDGLPTRLEALARWRKAYDGAGRGRVEELAMPEPYLGDITADVKMVVLALNPGDANLPFQGRDGVFATEIQKLGSYQAWAATWPYLSGSWVRTVGRNRHHEARLKFMRSWCDHPQLAKGAMLSFELFPWHSKGTTARIVPPAAIVREFIWEPIAEIAGDSPVFAFGAPWFPILVDGLGLDVIDRLGAGGRDYGSRVAARAVLVCRAPAGNLVVAEKHTGGAGPPANDEILRLKAALRPYL